MDVVGEGEECVARARDAGELARVLRTLLGGERRGHALEHGLPLHALTALEHLAADEEVDRVRLLRALDALLERQGQHARVVPQPPQVRLVACETRAVDARLLAGADADDRSAVCVRYAVRLCELESEGRDDEVGQGLARELDVGELNGRLWKIGSAHLLVFCHDVLKEFGIDYRVVASLLKVDTVYLSCLDIRGLEVGVDLGMK